MAPGFWEPSRYYPETGYHSIIGWSDRIILLKNTVSNRIYTCKSDIRKPDIVHFEAFRRLLAMLVLFLDRGNEVAPESLRLERKFYGLGLFLYLFKFLSAKRSSTQNSNFTAVIGEAKKEFLVKLFGGRIKKGRI